MKKEIKFPVNLIGIAGFAGSGKDTVATIIQGLTLKQSNEQIVNNLNNKYFTAYISNWQIKKFAAPVNDCYKIITGVDYLSLNREEKELHRTNFRDFANKTKEVFGEDVWVNALMGQHKLTSHKYKTGIKDSGIEEEVFEEPEYPNWIISDVRFLNEAKAITDRGGIVVRVNRENIEEHVCKYCGTTTMQADYLCYKAPIQHESETSLDTYNFDWIIDNSGTIEDLIEKVKEMLIHFKILEK